MKYPYSFKKSSVSLAAVLIASVMLTSCSVQIIGYGTSAEQSTIQNPSTSDKLIEKNPNETTAPITTPLATTIPSTTTAPQEDEPTPPKVIPNAKDVVGEIPESIAADPSWFDDACFIGDSISEGFRTYCLTGALGKAKFFAVRSYSLINALRPLSEELPHPSYQGERMTSEDCVQKAGSKKVFIMLGMNDLYSGIDKTLQRYQEFIGRILEKSPDATIFVQSMTPMTSTSKSITKSLNNANIKIYNDKLRTMCEENGWYFVNVASVMYDETGEALNSEYCSDKNAMGIHFNNNGYARWTEYLLTHTVNFG